MCDLEPFTHFFLKKVNFNLVCRVLNSSELLILILAGPLLR